MAEDFTKDPIASDASSPKTYTKKENSKYQPFRSDEDDSSDMDEMDTNQKPRRKIKKERGNTFKVKIKKPKGKKKEKDKEKDDRKVKKKVKKTSSSGDLSQGEYNDEPLHEPIFGVPLEVATERSCLPDGIPLPRIVRECIIYVEDSGLDGEGIYRLSGVKSKVDNLKQLYNEGRDVSLHEYDSTTVTSLLKLYLRELPSNILTTRLAPIFDSCIATEDPTEQLQKLQLLVNDLPCPNRTLLGWLFVHFQHVMDKTSETKMNIQNLSIVFSPTMSISHGVLNLLFTYSQQLFPDIKIVRYEPPKDLSELDMPETMEELEQLLSSNEAVLEVLHDRVNQGGSEDAKLMDEMWERQRLSTQIKRKIKTLQKADKQKVLPANTNEEVPTQEVVPPQEVSDGVHDQPVAEITTVKEQSDSVSRESVTDESNPAVSVEDVTLTVGDVHDEDNTGWNVDAAVSDDENNSKAPFQPSFNDGGEDDNFADFDNTDANEFVADFSGSNELVDQDVVQEDEPVMIESGPATELVNDVRDVKDEGDTTDVAVIGNGEVTIQDSMDVEEDKFDEEDECSEKEWNSLFWEEKKLSIENEELQLLQQLLVRKIESEQVEITKLKENLRQQKDSKQASRHSQAHSSSSSSSSSSSRKSSISEGESSASIDSSSDSEESSTELELMVTELEAENKRLQEQGRDLLQKIVSERQSCAMIRTQIRLLHMTKAMVL